MSSSLTPPTSPSDTQPLLEQLRCYKERCDQLIAESIPLLGEKCPLRDACEYALSSGGKRMRPMLVLMVAGAVNSAVDVGYAATAVEYFHTASLIADDLPCMDDEAERRNALTTHMKFGEAMALMATYALIATGYECLALNGEMLSASTHSHASRAAMICTIAVKNVSRHSGIKGAAGGQCLDLFPPDQTLNTLREMMRKKTATLFEISFLLGWLFGGGEIAKLPIVSSAATHFGLAFQIADDLADIAEDIEANRSHSNIAALLGADAARKELQEHIAHYLQSLTSLDIAKGELMLLPQLLLK